MSSPARPYNYSLNYLPTDQSVANKHKLVYSILNPDIFNKEERQRQEEDRGYGNNNDNKNSRQLQQKIEEDVVATLISKKVSNAYLSSKKDKSLRLANYDISLELSQDKLEGYSSGFSNDELNSNPVLINVDRELRSTKRKRLSLSNNLIYKKCKRYLKQRSNL